jgi:hypothetical protein
MGQERAEKITIRDLWLEEVRSCTERYPTDEGPVYLTLSGAQGKDIQLIMDHKLVKSTGVGGIAEEDVGKVVAVENSLPAVAELQRRFPGLRILEVNFGNLVAGVGPLSWPTGQHRHHCRARVVNLDFTKPLHAEDREGEIFFPVIALIEKLARLHAEPPRRDWVLCLTLHGALDWDKDASKFAQSFLAENFSREPRFATSCRDLLGTALYDEILSDTLVDFSALASEVHQKVLMAIAPKLVTQVAHDQGWKVCTERNLRYGGDGHARMVTWIIRFTWDANVRATPDTAYREALAAILPSAGLIHDDGQIEEGEVRANE